jgi:hypothetical protein
LVPTGRSEPFSSCRRWSAAPAFRCERPPQSRPAPAAGRTPALTLLPPHGSASASAGRSRPGVQLHRVDHRDEPARLGQWWPDSDREQAGGTGPQLDKRQVGGRRGAPTGADACPMTSGHPRRVGDWSWCPLWLPWPPSLREPADLCKGARGTPWKVESLLGLEHARSGRSPPAHCSRQARAADYLQRTEPPSGQ